MNWTPLEYNDNLKRYYYLQELNMTRTLTNKEQEESNNLFEGIQTYEASR